MCKLQNYLIAALCLGGAILISGCTTTDTYYSSTSYGVVPVYYNEDLALGSCYQPRSQVITYWPYYSRPFIQREYYYTWY